MAPKSKARSLNFMRHSTAEVCRHRWVSMDVRSRCSVILCACRISGSEYLSISPPTAPVGLASVLGDDRLSPNVDTTLMKKPHY